MIEVPVRILAEQFRPVQVAYTVAPGSATRGEDFRVIGNTLTFGPGENVKTLKLRILGDGEAEGPETIVLQLDGAASGVPLSDPVHGDVHDHEERPVAVRPSTRRCRRGCRPRRRPASVAGHRRSTRLRISPPAPMHVGAAGVHPRQRAAARRPASRPAGRRTRARRPPATTDWSMALSVVRRQVQHAGGDRRDRAGDADDGGRRRHGHRAARRGARRCRPRRRRPRAAVGGSAVQVPLVHPHRADVHRLRRAGPDASPRISSVDPPPMSTTSTGRAGRRREVADRAVVGQRGLLVRRDSTSGSTPSRVAHARGEDLGVRRRRASPTWRRTGSGRDVVRAGSARRTRRSRRTPAPAPRRPAARCGRRPGPSRTMRDSPHRDVRQVADQQLDGVGAAVDRRDRHAPTVRHRARLSHQSPSRSSTSSPSGFTPRPWRQRRARPARAGTSPGPACRRPRCPSISGTSPSASRGRPR